METIKRQTNEKIDQLKLTQDKKRQVFQFMIKEEKEVTEAREAKKWVSKANCKLVEPMSHKVEGMIDRVLKGSGKDNKTAKLEVRTNERIDGGTFLGMAFQKLERGKYDPPDDSSDSSNSNNDEPKPYKAKNGNKHNNNQEDSSSDAEEKPRAIRGRYRTIKPTPPKKYDGKANLHKYFKFVSQSVAYCDKGNISERD